MMAVVGQVARASKHEGYPTILVVGNRALLSRVVDTLQLAGYLVLIACNGEEALRVAKIHSRPIQILLADETVNARRLAAIMEPYRPEMRFLRVTGDATPALATVRQLLPAPKQRTTTG